MRAFQILPFLLLSACATGLKKPPSPVPLAPKSGRTVVLFLVDGFAVKTLRSGIASGRVPELQRFFLSGQTSFEIGQASFPSLTYPNISSILTARPVGEHPVISNHVMAPGGLVLNYEAAEFHPLLRATIDPISVVGTLARQGKETASFSYVFAQNATSHMRTGIVEGLEYQQHDYRALDGKLLGNLERFLRSRPARDWPEFIYVHLVGVDAISHRYGPSSQETQNYLAWLDSRMAGSLEALAQGEQSGQSVVTLLTADHGFETTTHHVGVAKLLRKADLGLVITNEGRFLGLHLPPEHSVKELCAALVVAQKSPGVEFTALNTGRTLELSNGKNTFRFAFGPQLCATSPFSLALLTSADQKTMRVRSVFQCPSDFDDIRSQYPFLVSSLSRFLTSPGAPRAVVLARPGVSFTGGSRGSHGGATADETFVPILLRNAELNGKKPARTSDLLKFLR